MLVNLPYLISDWKTSFLDNAFDRLNLLEVLPPALISGVSNQDGSSLPRSSNGHVEWSCWAASAAAWHQPPLDQEDAEDVPWKTFQSGNKDLKFGLFVSNLNLGRFMQEQLWGKGGEWGFGCLINLGESGWRIPVVTRDKHLYKLCLLCL